MTIDVDERGTTITTRTRKTSFQEFGFDHIFLAWLKKSITFKMNENFSVPYGDKGSNGAFNYQCSKPKQNIINCL